MGIFTSKTRVLNPEECDFTSLAHIGKKIYGYYKYHSEVLNIDNVYIIRDASRIQKDITISGATSSIIGTMLFGIIGAILTSGRRKLADQWSVDIDIILKDGRVIKVHSSDRAFIEAIVRYAKPIPIDPRQKMWKDQMEVANIEEMIRIEQARWEAENDMCDLLMQDYVKSCNENGVTHKKTITIRRKYLTTKKRINQIEGKILQLKNKIGENV